jgi:hypothetical protein
LREEAHSLALVRLVFRQGCCRSEALEGVRLPVDVLQQILLELVLLNHLHVLLGHENIEFLLELADLMGPFLVIEKTISALHREHSSHEQEQASHHHRFKQTLGP